MTVDEVIPAFLAVCPSIDLAWQEHLASWGDKTDRGVFNDVGVLAHHLVDRFERTELSEFPAVFALLERCLVEGDKQVQNVAIVGLIEDLQNIASHRTFGPWVFYEWLGPESRTAWDQLCVFWREVEEAKAAGLLEPRSAERASLPVDPNDVQDPALRRLVEQLYRK